MSRRKGTPEWDRGGGWMQVKPEWQDWDKAEDKTVTPAELQEMWCPASGSSISIDMNHVLPGLMFRMEVGAKEYKKLESGKVSKRKPTFLRSNIDLAGGIPKPGSEYVSTGGWNEKKTWSSAVKLMVNEIIPAYENAESESMCMWSVVHRPGIDVSELPEGNE